MKWQAFVAMVPALPLHVVSAQKHISSPIVGNVSPQNQEVGSSIILRGGCARVELEDAETPWPKGSFWIWTASQSLKESREDVAATCACAPLLRSNCLKSFASSSGGSIGGRLILLLGCACPLVFVSKQHIAMRSVTKRHRTETENVEQIKLV
jgi:hypothetical protein